MKRTKRHIVVCILFSFLMIFILFGCNENEENPHSEDFSYSKDGGDNDDDDDTANTPLSPAFCSYEDCSNYSAEEFNEMSKDLYLHDHGYCADIDADSPISRVLRIDDLIQSRYQRTLKYHVANQLSEPTYTMQEIYFQEELLDATRAQLYLPKTGSKPYPVILILHGHANSGELFFEKMKTWELLEKGIAVLALDIKMFGIMSELSSYMYGNSAHFIASRLMNINRTAYGLVVYQTMLALDFLESHTSIDNTRIAAIGHSGGGSLATVMVALDPRVKFIIVDNSMGWELSDNPIGLATPPEEKIQELFCGRIPQRLNELVHERRVYFYEYGYPDQTRDDALAKVFSVMKEPAGCGDGICGIGDSSDNCPSDCSELEMPITLVETQTPPDYYYEDFKDALAGLGNLFWQEYEGFQGNLVNEIKRITTFSGLEELQDCLPNYVAQTVNETGTHQTLSREYCFGSLGTVSVDLHFPNEWTKNSKIALFLSSLPNEGVCTGDQVVKTGLIEKGYAVIEPHFPYAEHDPDHIGLIQSLASYGISIQGLYLLIAKELTSAFHEEFCDASQTVAVYGNEGLALTSVLFALIDDRVERVVSGLSWPNVEPGTLPNDGLFHPADYFPGFALLGKKNELLNALSVPLLTFDRDNFETEKILNFYF